MISLKKIGIISVILFIMIQWSKIGMLHFFERAYQEGHLEFYPTEMKKYEIYAFKEMNTESPIVCIGAQNYEVKGEESKEGQKVRGLGVNQNYPIFEPMQLVKGSFWMEQAEAEGRSVVVISKQLAAKLFNTYEVIGEILDIGDSRYQIIGVYDQPKDFIHTLSDFGEEVIYFPITSPLGKALDVKSIWFKDAEVIKQMSLETGTLYQADDAAKRLKSITWVSVNLLGMVLIMYLLKKGIDVAFFKSQYTLKEKASYLVLYGIWILVIAKGVMIHIYIPSEVLPSYNIFDLNYYWGYFKEQLVLHYQMLRLSENSFEVINWLLTKWGLGLTLIQLVLCFPIAQNGVELLDTCWNRLLTFNQTRVK